MSWQPISTAPRDGKRILACNEKQVRIVQWCADQYAKKPRPYFASYAGLGASYERDFSNSATHWMPLPELPPPATPPERADFLAACGRVGDKMLKL